MPKAKNEKEFLKEKLNSSADYSIALLAWILLFYSSLGFLYVYTSFPPALTGFDEICQKEDNTRTGILLF